MTKGTVKPREPVWCGCVRPIAEPNNLCRRCWAHVPIEQEWRARGYDVRPVAAEPLDRLP